MMFSSEVNEVKALRKHLKNMDNMNTNTRKNMDNTNSRKMRKAMRQNVEKKTDNIPVDTKSIECCKKPKQMHIYMPSIQ